MIATVVENAAGGLIALALLVYLVIALLHPERF
ncbi:K(+)-transporting ATPase subunit F [Pseudonocardia tropica]|uniref:K(+)-transporting ATPase subunit F n=1 Tax=Pseudonocardia tropica TaxID=681289 RepID=A0ABV1JRU9_9PSEU